MAEWMLKAEQRRSDPLDLARQAAAVPFRIGDKLEFCLITSSNGRWLFPKGCIEKGESFADTARKEALEEAGLRGTICEEPVGFFEHEKRGETLTIVALLMEVEEAKAKWQEDDRRKRRWLSYQGACDLITQDYVRKVLDRAADRIAYGFSV